MPKTPSSPILASALFPELRAALLDVLRPLTAAQWETPTVCAGWSVKDVALHILGDDLGSLSRRRDGFSRQHRQFDGWDDRVQWLNEQNELWVQATRRFSPPLLCDLLRLSGAWFYAYVAALDPYQLGGPVSWAGSDPAPVWLDIAREYTEYWLHQQHIGDALGFTSLKERRFFQPVVDTFARAMPYTYRDVVAEAGTTVTLILTGVAGDQWFLVRENGRWVLYAEVDTPSDCVITLPAEIAWRLFTKGLTHAEARPHAQIEGRAELAEPIFQMVSIIA